MYAGHNNPPFDFVEFVRGVLMSSASTAQKLMSVSIALKAHDGGGRAAPRRSEILHMASISEATFKRSYAALKVFFEMPPGGGQQTNYFPKPFTTPAEIETAISNMTLKKRCQNDTRKRNIGCQNDTGLKKEIPPTPPKEKNITTLDWRARENLDLLETRLFEAANGAAANPSVAPNILMLSEPIKWLEGGCDLELDILPTVRAKAHKMRPGSVKNWSYFTNAIADAKAARLAPMPEGRASATGQPHWRDEERERSAKLREALARAKEKYAG